MSFALTVAVCFLLQICSRRFRSHSHLAQHQRTSHSGSKPSLSFLERTCQLKGGTSVTSSAINEGKAAPVDGGGNNSGQSSNKSVCSVSPQSSSTGTAGSNSGGDLEGGDDGYTVEYPSHFPGLKHRISIKNETVLVTRLDGVDVTSGGKQSLFKCHMCGRIFNFLSRLQCHLSMHFERHLTVYTCWCCEASFSFKTQLMQHVSQVHDIEVSQHGTEQPLSPALSSPPDGTETEHTSAMEMAARSTDREEALRDMLSSGLDSDKIMDKKTYQKVDGLYVCRFCNKSFDRLFSVHRHERVHTGFKPCYCKHCGRGFFEPRNLRHHIIRFHSDGSELHKIRRDRKRQNGEGREDCGHPLQGDIYSSYVTSSPEPPRLRAVTPTASTSHIDTAEIRQQEDLDEDITVVIPSEPPLENKDPNLATPQSTLSESSSWAATMSEVDADNSTSEIMSAPVTSIMSYKQPAKKRKASMHEQPPATPPLEVNNTVKEEDEKKDMEVVEMMDGDAGTADIVPADPQEHATVPEHVNSQQQQLHGHPQQQQQEQQQQQQQQQQQGEEQQAEQHGEEAKPTSRSLPYSALSVSTFMPPGALPGYLPTPLMSPLAQSFFAPQHCLTSPTLGMPSLVSNHLPYLPPLPTPPSSSLAAHSSAAAISRSSTSPASEPTPASYNMSAVKEEPSDVPWSKGRPLAARRSPDPTPGNIA